MKALIVALAMLAAPHSQSASLSCAELQNLVQSRGSTEFIVNKSHYVRYYAHPGYCRADEKPSPVRVNAEGMACFVGYRCLLEDGSDRSLKPAPLRCREGSEAPIFKKVGNSWVPDWHVCHDGKWVKKFR